MSNNRYFNGLQVPNFVLKDTASCSTVDPELFFPQEIEFLDGKVHSVYKNYAAAKEICSSCPLITDCLEYALNHGEFGIWGGTTEEQRRNLRRRSGLPKVSRRKTPINW